MGGLLYPIFKEPAPPPYPYVFILASTTTIYRPASRNCIPSYPLVPLQPTLIWCQVLFESTKLVLVKLKIYQSVACAQFPEVFASRLRMGGCGQGNAEQE